MKINTYFKGPRLYVSIVLIIAFIGAIYFLNQAGIFRNLKFGGLSLTPLSCSRGNFVSNDAFFQNGSYFCEVAAQGAQSFELTLSPDEVKRLYGVSTTKTVIVDGEITKQLCTYALSNVSKPVYSIGLDLRHLYCNVPDIFFCGDQRKAPWIKIGSTGVSGCRYDIHNCNCDPTKGQKPSPGSCDASYYQPVGRIYTIDQSSLQREFEFKITTTIDGKQYVNYITDKNSTFYNTIIRGQYVGSFLGSSNCAPPTLDVFLDSQNGNAISYVDKFLGDSVGSKSTTIISSHSQAVNNGESYNDEVNAMKSSAKSSPESFFGQYCQPTTTADITRNTARVSCTPETPATIPVVNLYFNAAEIKISAPSGQPQIQNVQALPAQAAQKLDVAITAKNTAERATFDFSLSCDKISPTVFTVRATLDKDEVKTVNVPTTYAGVSATCLAQVTSVNSPQIKDSKTVTLTFYPFCTLTNTNPAQSLVNTEFGCSYICSNYKDSFDVLDGSCQPLNQSLYDRCNAYNGTICIGGYKTYPGIHCTGVGTYLSTNQYLDQLNSKKIQPFVPTTQPHKFFIVTSNGKPVCNYINEFGYKDGNAVSVDSFDYTSQFPSANQGTAPPPLSSPQDTPVNVPPNTGGTQNPPPASGTPSLPSLPTEIGGLNTTVVLIVGGIIIVAIGYGVFRSMKKRR